MFLSSKYVGPDFWRVLSLLRGLGTFQNTSFAPGIEEIKIGAAGKTLLREGKSS